jgi:hypothetical protein
MENKDKKTTNEKPISLYPLNFRDVLEASLKIKPEPKPTKKKQRNQKKTGG